MDSLIVLTASIGPVFALVMAENRFPNRPLLQDLIGLAAIAGAVLLCLVAC